MRAVRYVSFAVAVMLVTTWVSMSALAIYGTSSAANDAEGQCMWRYWAATWPVWKVAPDAVAQGFVDWTFKRCAD